jgi:hypothetical protein
MKLFGTRVLPLLVFMLVMTGLVEQGKGNTCPSTFFSALVQLIPCRAAVAPFSPVPPSEACCNALKVLGQPCLCVLVNGPPISGVDRNMALQLPEKCTANFEPCTLSLSLSLSLSQLFDSLVMYCTFNADRSWGTKD